MNPSTSKSFLIVDGSKIINLDKPLTNIGRSPDNHVVIDDLRISRYHAQIREEQDGFLLIDLRSTGGTSVNGEAITKVKLAAGDIISLSGIPIIYGETDKFPTDATILENMTGSDKDSGRIDTTFGTPATADDYIDLFKDDKK
jgi:pSer/pThr/pTyr-binding forkhead associated (FHA) protein